MNIQTENETAHNDLLTLVNPLISFMAENGYSFMFVAGKDGTCTRHLKGSYDDIEAMLSGMAEKNKQVAAIFKGINQ
jgi:hypothetical protein